MMVTDGEGVPLTTHLASASLAEVQLLEVTLANISVKKKGKKGRPQKKPKRLIGDRGYDSNQVRADLSKKGIMPIIPARSNHRKATHQDGRALRRYKKRYKVERTFAWILSFRRLTVRWERLDFMYDAFVHLACVILILRRF
jgi:transposase